MTLDSFSEDVETEVEEASEADELKGKMASNPDEERLAHSVLENDEQTVKDGKVLTESVDYALNSFTPDLMFEKLVSNFKDAQRLFGPTIIRELTGFNPKYIDNNKKISEFQEQLKENIRKNLERMQNEGYLDDEGKITEEGFQLASLVMYTDELDKLETKGLGKKQIREHSHYGEKSERKKFQKDRYKDLDIRGTIRQAIRRGHSDIHSEDLRAHQRKQHGQISVIYALDASGSMRGSKITTSKKAGVALAYKAIEDRNQCGLVVFTGKVQQSIPPTQDFPMLLHHLVRTRAGQETDISKAIDHAVQLFPRGDGTKHLVLISDAIPTTGEQPGKDAVEAASRARDEGVTISLVGIELEKEGEKLAKKLVEIGEGKLYKIRNLDDMDTLILEDYERLK